MDQNIVVKSNTTKDFNSLITISANELNENANYTFQIIISNMIANDSSGIRNFRKY